MTIVSIIQQSPGETLVEFADGTTVLVLIDDGVPVVGAINGGPPSENGGDNEPHAMRAVAACKA